MDDSYVLLLLLPLEAYAPLKLLFQLMLHSYLGIGQALKEYVEEDISKSHTSENGVIEKWKDADKGFIQSIVDDEVSQLKTIIEEYKKDE